MTAKMPRRTPRLSRADPASKKSPIDNAITTQTETKKQALEHFNMCPFNFQNKCDQGDGAPSQGAEGTEGVHGQETPQANNKGGTLQDHAQNHNLECRAETLADKHAASKTPFKKITKEAGVDKRPCPNQLLGCKLRSSTDGAQLCQEYINYYLLCNKF